MISRMVIACALLLGILGSVNAAERHDAFYRNFWFPHYHGKRLNYCTQDGKECGLPVATRFCQIMGYCYADQQLIDYGVGETYFLSTKLLVQCKGCGCNGFKTIRCVAYSPHKPAKIYHYRLRRFVYPRYNDARVSWCYDGLHGCGQRAAHSFCRRMGYMKAHQFAIQKQIGSSKAIGNQRICFSDCDGFEYISCFR